MAEQEEKETKVEETENVSSDEIVDETAENQTAEEADGAAEEQEVDELSATKGQLEELKDKHLRLQAEFDNYRRRTLKEKADLISTAGEKVLKDLLPIIDDFDRAMEAVKTAQDIAAVQEGMTLIVSKFNNFLSAQGVSEIEAKEQDFDADKHEAVTKFPAPSEDLKGKVIDVVQKGYTLNGKVMRYAKVVVGE